MPLDETDKPDLDALVVGAGFAGMYMLYSLRQLGMRVLVVEKAAGVGGTWYWNRYPGARCDIESMQYSHSFSAELEQEWVWSERYASQPEILDYANHVADRFDLRRDIRLSTRVDTLRFDEAQNCWNAVLFDHAEFQSNVSARFCIMATGCLSEPHKPDLKGLETFSGEVYHTGKWPHKEVDFSGKKVAVIGTGSSAIQCVPLIAEQADHVTVFQRTPNFIVPSRNRPFEPGEQDKVKQNYAELRKNAKLARNGVAQEIVTERAVDVSDEQRYQRYESRWQDGGLTFIGAYADLLLDREANDTAVEFVRKKIFQTVKDPHTAEILAPSSTFGCKRLCVDSHYYEAFNRSNVSLVDISSSPIESICTRGPVVDGKTWPADCIVLATGFDAMTGSLNKINIIGRQGRTLRQKWHDGPSSYLGLMTEGFPNLFTITGPASPSVLSNVLTSIEFHVQWITACLEHMKDNEFQLLEPTGEAQQKWMETLNNVVDKTLYRSCNSWYLGENIPGKPKTFMPFPGVPSYEKKCQQIAKSGYPGFTFIVAHHPAP
jgi:cyclohexanone monooxygenase